MLVCSLKVCNAWGWGWAIGSWQVRFPMQWQRPNNLSHHQLSHGMCIHGKLKSEVECGFKLRHSHMGCKHTDIQGTLFHAV